MGGHGGHAAPLGLYWTVDEGKIKTRREEETQFMSRG